MFKFCVVALALAVAVMSVNGYYYYPGYVGGLERGIYSPFVGVYPPYGGLVDGKLVDGKSVEAKIEGVVGVYPPFAGIYPPFAGVYPPIGGLVDGKSIETKIEGVAGGITYLNHPLAYSRLDLRIARGAEESKLEDLKPVEN